MLEQLIFELGYVGLFLISFLASTLFPLSSAAFIVLMLSLDYNPWIILLVATLGTYLGAILNYYVGKLGNHFLFSKYMKINPSRKKQLEEKFNRYGSPILFFSWLPIVGDPICLVAGVFNIKLSTFSFWVLFGRILRFLFIIGVTLAII
jgi:membrane protein YqaA with SNARE-associated domain